VSDSKFHSGEIELQTRVGVQERLGKSSQAFMRDHMPAQHRDFFTKLPFMLVGHRDADGAVWASIVTGKPGFIRSPNNTALSIHAPPIEGDPLRNLLADVQNNHISQPRLGLLGIELETRRRNRLNGQVMRAGTDGFEIEVIQSFGNCPKYIHVRDVSHLTPNTLPSTTVTKLNSFSEEAQEIIANSTTFFVASTNQHSRRSAGQPEYVGADVSHRGGEPGFIRIDDERTLTIPDYKGNNFYNTFGNFLVNPSAGLLFVNFANSDVLMLTGKAELFWDKAEQDTFAGSLRTWRFTLKEGMLIKNALGLKYGD